MKVCFEKAKVCPVQEEIDRIYNLGLDAANLSIMPMFRDEPKVTNSTASEILITTKIENLLKDKR